MSSDVPLSSFRYDILSNAFHFLYALAPIWLPTLLFIALVVLYVRYKRTEAVMKMNGVLLELRLPKEINKTPLAMELVLTAIFAVGASTFLETFIKGKIRPWFSLELVSIDGQVHFYIWTPKAQRKHLETQLYAQYPGLEVVEVEDYARNVFHDPSQVKMWGAAFKLTKDDVYPIKTYIDYGLDKRGEKEEFKTDPMTSMLEFLGSVRRGEQVWFQFVIQAHRAESFKEDALFGGRPKWSDPAKAEVKKKISELVSGDKARPPTDGEKELISAIERSQSKFAFEATVRGMYICQKDLFDPSNITGIIGTLRQYNSNTLNGFKISRATSFDLPWQDFRGTRKTEREKKLLNAFKLRSFFQTPYRHYFGKPFILTTEELATIFHLPGAVATTPTLVKTQSRKGEAPANLPI